MLRAQWISLSQTAGRVGDAIRQEQAVLILCLCWLLESSVWHPDQQDEHISFLLSSTGMWRQSFAYPILYWIHLLEALLLTWSAKSLNMCPHQQVQTFALSSPSGCEAALAGTCAARIYVLRQLNSDSVMQIKRDFPAASSLHLVGPKWVHGCPVPLCVGISNVNVNPVNFHTFVIIPSEASHSPPLSWSCWENLDLWQCRMSLDTYWSARVRQWHHHSIKHREKPGWGGSSFSSTHVVTLIYQPLPQRTGSKTDGRGRLY